MSWELKRPSVADTEEDLLRQQEEFLQGQSKRQNDDQEKNVKRTKTAQLKSDAAAADNSSEKQYIYGGEDAEDMLEDEDNHITKILTSITERDFSGSALAKEMKCRTFPGGFPTASRRSDQDVSLPTVGKKMSIFARQFLQRSEANQTVKSGPDSNLESQSSDSVSGDVVERWWPKAADGDARNQMNVEATQADKKEDSKFDVDIDEVRQENDRRLNEMSESEILKQQEELLKTLDPGVIAFLKSRKELKSSSGRRKNIAPTTASVKDRPMSRDFELQPVVCEEKMTVPKKITKQLAVNDKDQPMSKDIIAQNASELSPLDSLTHGTELPLTPHKKWVHMDQVEHEKLAWMKDLPPPTAGNSQTGKPARFDFEGRLVAAEADVPVHLGLHHHGLEPERAGYSLEELFQLSRSIHVPQRTLALNVICKIIKNARRGEFYGCLSTCIIPSLLDAGLVFILRWALDDSIENSLTSAISTLHALLVSEEDEIAADTVFTWYPSGALPSLCVLSDETDGENNTAEETDADVVKRDVIEGLLRMSVLERLCYLIDKCRSSAVVVVEIIEIIMRVARHSQQSAYKVFNCSRLIEVLLKEFLPLTWTPLDVSKPLSSAYGYPLPAAMKLVRVIAAAGRNMAALLISKYNLMGRVLRYLSEQPSELLLHSDQANYICIESWYTWQTLLQYGIGLEFYQALKAIDGQLMKLYTNTSCPRRLRGVYYVSLGEVLLNIDFYQVIMERLTKCCMAGWQSELSSCRLACSVVGVVEAALRSAGVAKHTTSFAESDDVSMDTGEPFIPFLNWNLCRGLNEIMSTCLDRCLKEFAEHFFDEKYDLTFAACCLNYFGTYYSKVDKQPDYSPLNIQRQIELLMNQRLIPILKSRAFSLALQCVRQHSVLLYESEADGKTEVANNLPSLGSLVGQSACQCPVLNKRTTIHFVLALARLLLNLGKLNRTVVDMTYSALLSHEETLQYLRRICQLPTCLLAANHFATFENHLQFYLVSMARLEAAGKKGTSIDMTAYHMLSLSLLSRLHPGDEHIAHDIMSTIIFNVDFLSDVSSENDVGSKHFDESLQLHGTVPLSSATQQRVDCDVAHLTADITSHLSTLRATYLQVAPVTPLALIRSRQRMMNSSQDVDSSLTGVVGQLLVPLDWVFLPLVGIYERAINTQSVDGTQDRVPPALVASVTNALRAVYLLERWRSSSLAAVSLLVKLSRLMCTFVAGCDLFLDPTIHRYLAGLLRIYCKPVHLNRLNFRQSVPGLASFYDFYIQLVNQYEAVSFGDSLFGCYVLLPLQQEHSITLRKAVWGEHITVLRSLSIPISEMVVPMSRFLEPDESDIELLKMYCEAVLSGAVTVRWSPVMYLIAIHHINRFIYTVDSTHIHAKYTMIRRFASSQDEKLRHHVFYYKRYHADCDLHMELYDVLPSLRQATMEAATSK